MERQFLVSHFYRINVTLWHYHNIGAPTRHQQQQIPDYMARYSPSILLATRVQFSKGVRYSARDICIPDQLSNYTFPDWPNELTVVGYTLKFGNRQYIIHAYIQIII